MLGSPAGDPGGLRRDLDNRTRLGEPGIGILHIEVSHESVQEVATRVDLRLEQAPGLVEVYVREGVVDGTMG